MVFASSAESGEIREKQSTNLLFIFGFEFVYNADPYLRCAILFISTYPLAFAFLPVC